MTTILIFLQLIVALGIYNVWLIRYGKETKWRGGTAQNMKEEFATYGLPLWFMISIGTTKVFLATLLIVGIWVPVITKSSAVILAVLMLGAISMHIKVKDSLKKSLPALTMFLLSISVFFLS